MPKQKIKKKRCRFAVVYETKFSRNPEDLPIRSWHNSLLDAKRAAKKHANEMNTTYAVYGRIGTAKPSKKKRKK